MGTRMGLFAVVHSGEQWRGTSGTATKCRETSRTWCLGRGPAGAPRFGARRAEPPWPCFREAGSTRTGRLFAQTQDQPTLSFPGFRPRQLTRLPPTFPLDDWHGR
jgi:hypothetical protein